MSIFIIGCQGSMGRRYQAILNYLGQPYFGVDQECDRKYLFDYADHSTGVILATPTDTHLDILKEILPARKPILCEKPICKDPLKLRDFLKEVKRRKIPFHMMYQYKNLVPTNIHGASFYDYFRHGSDGLYWDCIQIIGLAKGAVGLEERSPIFKCMINGRVIDLSDMDKAYVQSVESFLRNDPQDMGELLTMHEKVIVLKNEKLSDHRDSGTLS